MQDELPTRDEIQLERVLHALSDPQRLKIVRVLSEDGESRPCGSFDLDISKSTKTHHFRVLRESGLITQEAQGNCRMTSLRSDDINARFPGLLDAVLAAEREPAAA